MCRSPPTSRLYEPSFELRQHPNRRTPTQSARSPEPSGSSPRPADGIAITAKLYSKTYARGLEKFAAIKRGVDLAAPRLHGQPSSNRRSYSTPDAAWIADIAM